MHRVLYIKKYNKHGFQPFTENKLRNISFDVFSVDDLKSLKLNYELYLAEVDFQNGEYTAKLARLIAENPDKVFWAITENCDKEQVLSSYNIGFQNVVAIPIEKDILEQHFSKDDIGFDQDFQNSLDENISIIQGSKVLIVDDNPMNVMLLKDSIQIFNLDITGFSNSKEALVCTEQRRFDLILLDIMMPDINGFEFAKLLKQNDINKNTPVVFISALSETENKIQGYNLGSYAYIEKPFDINTLRAQISNILKIKKLQEEKETFIATLTHDLKTPIRAQIRALELLIDNRFGELKSEQAEIAIEILNSCKFMAHMTDNVLARYKYDNGQMQIKKSKNSLKKLIESCSEKLKYLIEPKNQVLKIVYNTSVDELEFDELEMGRVINNLVTNASEYSDNNSQITLQVDTEENYLKVSIIDSGTGIAPKEIDGLFDKYMTDAKRFRKVGFGLGLYVTKKIIEGHAGTITVESTLGVGSKFIFTLPLAEILVS